MKPFIICVSLFVVIFSSFFTSLTVGKENDEIWSIIPGVKVGPITSNTSEADLIQIYGKNNITDEKMYIDNEGQEAEIGTVIYPKDPMKLIKILWKDAKKKKFPKRIQISGDKSNWRTAEGVSLGTSLKELEKINNSTFNLWGFGWDSGGFIRSWEKGKLEKYSGTVELRLTPKHLSPKEHKDVIGDRVLNSNDETLQILNPTVHEIFIYFK